MGFLPIVVPEIYGSQVLRDTFETCLGLRLFDVTGGDRNQTQIYFYVSMRYFLLCKRRNRTAPRIPAYVTRRLSPSLATRTTHPAEHLSHSPTLSRFSFALALTYAPHSDIRHHLARHRGSHRVHRAPEQDHRRPPACAELAPPVRPRSLAGRAFCARLLEGDH